MIFKNYFNLDFFYLSRLPSGPEQRARARLHNGVRVTTVRKNGEKGGMGRSEA